MAFGPNFADVVVLEGEQLKVSGEVPPHEGPVDLLIYLEQDGKVTHTRVTRFDTAWTEELPTEGIGPGPALAFGVEIRKLPFQATTWTEVVTVS
jgi:hypothetical protein